MRRHRRRYESYRHELVRLSMNSNFLQGALLDGHCLELKLSNQPTKKPEVVARSANLHAMKQHGSLKILVRNVPFQVRHFVCVLSGLTFLQATKKELIELFSAFGELSSVRMPTKTAVGERKQHRGFAFVQMSTAMAARRAFDALVHR